MVQINYARREVSCKVVYYGPGLSGKTTNIEIIHEKDPNKEKGNLTSIATEGDRTLYFDYKPLDLGQISGMTTKFQLYTVPGQLYYNSTRKLVLTGADGVVFVADSQKTKMNDNLASLQNLEENLKEHDMELSKIPFILQYNKRDLPNICSIEEMNAALNKYNNPYHEAVAFKGTGVFETLKAIASAVLKKVSTDADLVKERGSRIAPKRPQVQAANYDPGMTAAYPASAPYPTPTPTPTPYNQAPYTAPPSANPLGYNPYSPPQGNPYGSPNPNYSQQPPNYNPQGGMGYRPPYPQQPPASNYPSPPGYGMGTPQPPTSYPQNVGGGYSVPPQPNIYAPQQPQHYRPGAPNPYSPQPPSSNYPKPMGPGNMPPTGHPPMGNYPHPNQSGIYNTPPQNYPSPQQHPASYPKGPGGYPQQPPNYPPQPPPGYNPNVQSGLYPRPPGFPQPPKKPGIPPTGGNPEKK